MQIDCGPFSNEPCSSYINQLCICLFDHFTQLAKSSSYREEGKKFFQLNNLVAARLCYNEALDHLIPNFHNLEKTLPEKGCDVYPSNKMKHLSKEIAMIFGNRSLVMLKEGDIGTAIADAQQGLTFFRTAKVRR